MIHRVFHVLKVVTVKAMGIPGRLGSVVLAGGAMEVQQLIRPLHMVLNANQAITVLKGLRIQQNVMGASSVMLQASVSPKETAVLVTSVR